MSDNWEWIRRSAGYYECGGYEIIWQDSETGSAWFCYWEGVVFDRADTLAEAKSYCQKS